MYLSHLSLTPVALANRGVQAAIGRGIYGHHQLLCKLFGSARKGSFLFRHLDGEAGMHFYTLSLSEPEVCKHHHWACSSKLFRPILQEGQRLSFSVRINPTINRSEGPSGDATGRRRHKRRDLIYEAVREYRASNTPMPSRHAIAQSSGEDWLDGRLHKAGFALDRQQAREGNEPRAAVTCTAYRQHRSSKGSRKLTVSTLDCQGVGTVTDPVAFESLLQNGLGPAKGFGCGLMLIRPA